MTIKELYDQYVKSQGYTKLSVNTKRSYNYCADRLADYFDETPIETLKRSSFIKFQNDHQETPAYANLATRVASVMFSFAVDMDIMPFNPVAGLKKLKIGSHVKWTPEEVRSVIAMNDRKISTAVALAWYTGQRESDILDMRWEHISDGYINVTQQKTGLEMKIKLHPDLEKYLNNIRNGEPGDYFIVSGPVFMSGSGFRNMLRRRLKKMNIDKVFHGIRKGVASMLAENGRPINEIAAMLGHKSIRMAAYYAEQASGKKLTESAVSNVTSTIGQGPY